MREIAAARLRARLIRFTRTRVLQQAVLGLYAAGLAGSTMAENKTKPTDASVEDYIASRAERAATHPTAGIVHYN